MLSHLEDDGPVRVDGVKLAVLEVMGLELDEPKLGAFAGSLNALDFPVQLLVRQHPPVLSALRNNAYRVPAGGPAAADERRRRQPGAAADHAGDPGGHPGPAFLRRLRARPRRRTARPAGASRPRRVPAGWRFTAPAAACLGPGRLPDDRDLDAECEVEVNRRDIRIGDRLTRSLHLGKWPRSLAPGFLQGLMAAGAPMDLSVHLGRDSRGAGGTQPGVAEGPVRVGPVACRSSGAAPCPPRPR